MGDFKTIKYNTNNRSIWDEFIADSKNATFLFRRDFIEYHQDRFSDNSLMVYKNNTLFALLPAIKALVCKASVTFTAFALFKAN